MSIDFEEARGGYLGPCSPDEAVQALATHTTGPVLVECVSEFLDEPIHAVGYCSQLGDHDTPVFAFSPKTDVPLGCAVAYRGAFVLDLSWTGSEPLWTAERYTGGLDLRFPSGLVRLAFRHEVYHGTVSGDLAPGFGPLDACPTDANN